MLCLTVYFVYIYNNKDVMCKVKCLLQGCFMFIQCVRSVTCIVYFLHLPLWNFLNVGYVYIPIHLAYLKWMDTITCSQWWDNDWTDVQCSWTSIKRIFCLCGVLEVLLWLIFAVLQLFILCILNHCFLVHAKFKLGMCSL